MEWNSSSSSPSPETKICLFTYMKIHSLLHSFDKHTVMEPPLQLRYRIFSSPLKYSLMQYSQCLAPSHVLLSLWLPFPECRIKKTIEYPFNFVLSRFSHIQLFATLWTVACQASLSIEILQARILEWVAIPFFQGIFLIQGSNPGLLHCRQILYHLNYVAICCLGDIVF